MAVPGYYHAAGDEEACCYAWVWRAGCQASNAGTVLTIVSVGVGKVIWRVMTGSVDWDGWKDGLVETDGAVWLFLTFLSSVFQQLDIFVSFTKFPAQYPQFHHVFPICPIHSFRRVRHPPTCYHTGSKGMMQL